MSRVNTFLCLPAKDAAGQVDHERILCDVALLAPRVTHKGNGAGVGPTRIARIIAPSSMRNQDLTAAIEYTFTSAPRESPHWAHDARVLHRPSAREYVVRFTVSYTY